MTRDNAKKHLLSWSLIARPSTVVDRYLEMTDSHGGFDGFNSANQIREDFLDWLTSPEGRELRAGVSTVRDGASGLAIDCLDSDRLRIWAEKLDTHGPDISHWADKQFVITCLRDLADRIDTTVKDVGALRAGTGMSSTSGTEAQEHDCGPAMRKYLGTDK